MCVYLRKNARFDFKNYSDINLLCFKSYCYTDSSPFISFVSSFLIIIIYQMSKYLLRHLICLKEWLCGRICAEYAPNYIIRFIGYYGLTQASNVWNTILPKTRRINCYSLKLMNNNSRTLRKRDSAHNFKSKCKTEMVKPYTNT